MPPKAVPPTNVPDVPGVYLFKGPRGKILYVGKARSLKKRVASYFTRGAESSKTEALLRSFTELETIVTNTNLEALLLENTLIKKHRPRYNICLRDDKTYPYIKVTTGEPWPRAFVTRRVQDDGHSYFGPFWGGLARRIMRMITRHFQIRTCSIEIDGKLPRPCLYYDLHACLGPCVAGLTTHEAYAEAVRDVVLFLQGRNRELIPRLEAKMTEAAAAENFEMAAAYRDAIRTVEDVAERQLVQSMKGESIDVFGFFEAGEDVSVAVLVVRGGVLQDRREFFFEKSEEVAPAAFLEAFLPQFYDVNPFLPEEVHLPVEVVGPEAARGLSPRSPGQPESRSVFRNAAPPRSGSSSRTRTRRSATGCGFAGSAGRRLSASSGSPGFSTWPFPRGASRPSTSLTSRGRTASRRSWCSRTGRPKKSDYRLFGIASQSLLAPDDFRSMAEAVERRYRRVRDEGGVLPDLVVVDGGRGQLQAALSALDRVGLELPVVGLAKREEEIWAPDRSDPIRLSAEGSRAEARPEAAGRGPPLRHHAPSRRRRSKRMRETSLTDIPGVGPTRARILLRRFGSLAGVAAADPSDVEAAVGPATARAVANYIEQGRAASA